MYETLKYYLGNLATRDDLSEQAMHLRELAFSSADEVTMLDVMTNFCVQQDNLFNDTIAIINTLVMPAYGYEFLGAGGAEWEKKGAFFKMLIIKFPAVFGFKFYYADCAGMAGREVEDLYPVLEEGMRQDISNKYYPSAELFELIAASAYSFRFDLLLLEKYYQPCSREDFYEHVSDLAEKYTSQEQVERLKGLFWKG